MNYISFSCLVCRREEFEEERRGWHIAWLKLASQVSAIVGTYELHSILTAPAIFHLCEFGNGLERDGGRRVANCSIKNDYYQ